MKKINKIKIIKMNVDILSMNSCIKKVSQLISKKKGAYVCLSNVNNCMAVYDSPSYEKIINNADIVLPDGRPIFWAQKLLGIKRACQIRGFDLFHSLCKHADQNNLRIGFYGGTDNKVLNLLCKNINQKYPNLQVKYRYSPPFFKISSVKKNSVINKINKSNIDMLFVGIGCPKQEIWMAENKGKLNIVMFGIGAAFDFEAGIKSHAPKIVQYVGLEWLYRLLSEPKRLWKRYFIQNPRFIYFFLRQFLSKKK